MSIHRRRDRVNMPTFVAVLRGQIRLTVFASASMPPPPHMYSTCSLHSGYSPLHSGYSSLHCGYSPLRNPAFTSGTPIPFLLRTFVVGWQ